MRRRPLYLALGFVVTAMFGYWLARTAAPVPEARVKTPVPENGPVRRVIVDDEPPPPKPRHPCGKPAAGHRCGIAGALPGQRVLAFKDRAALEDFLKRAGDKVRIMGRLDALNALRVGFLNADDLTALLSGDEEASLIYPVDAPSPVDASAQAGAVPL
ncbi:MAG: hypothetical protein EOP88_19305, partial [Verrucomicrobiaceae bacterium]